MDDRNNSAGRNFATTLMLDSVARTHGRHLSQAAVASGPLMFEVAPAAVARAAAARGERASDGQGAEAASGRKVDWARRLAAGAARLRNEVRGR